MQSLLPYVINGISAGGQYALIAIGYTLVYGILRLINFAHGDVFMVAGLMMIYFTASLPMYLALPLVVVCTALLGFLIYNFNPARVVMGDTGSLFLGGCISGLAFALDVPLLLIPLCIMPIIETLSDIIQVAYFKLSHGKRVFKMAPFHHHLEMGGWTGRKWKEKEIFVLFAGITLVMAVVSLLGVTGRYSF